MSADKLLQVKLPAWLLDRVDEERGPVSRRAWVLLLIAKALGVDPKEIA